MLGCTGGVKTSHILLHIMRSHISPTHPFAPTPPTRFRPLALLSISDHFIVFHILLYRRSRDIPRDHCDMHWGSHQYHYLPLQNCYRYKIVTATKLLPLQNCYLYKTVTAATTCLAENPSVGRVFC